MKKSCSDKQSKVVTTQDVENVLRGSKGQGEQLTEEQVLINLKLKESDIDDEGLGWLEKRNIFKTINVSLGTAGSERLQRSSPRLCKLANLKAAKWIENSFENSKNEESDGENTSKSKQCKKNLDSNLCKKLISTQTNKRKCTETEEPDLQPKTKKGEKLHRDGDAVQCDSPKSSRQVHYIKIQIEDKSEECNSVAVGVNPGLSARKKRTSQTEKGATEAPKKIKMEETSNGVFPEEDVPLNFELDLESKNESAPFKIRDIKTIVSECEIRNKKWKETFLKYKCPTRWGIPIVKNCSQKWDGKQIPPKLLLRYQKYLSSKNMTHPVFLPIKSQSSVDLNKLCSQSSSQSSTCGNGECRDESESDLKNSEGSFGPGESSGSGLENNLNASTSPRDNTGRMVLRNRSQQKTIILDDDEFSSDDSDDWLAQQKGSKKQKFNAKNKKAADQSNNKLVLKLERCNINRGNGNEGGRKNGNKNDSNFTGGPPLSSSGLNQGTGNTKLGPDPDTMVCPICSFRFKKQHIESHATECASKTYKD